MKYLLCNQEIKWVLAYFRWLHFVLSGFAHDHMDVGGRVTHGAVTEHLASHFGRPSSNHSWRYGSSNDQPSCFASYSANPGSLVKCPGQPA